MGRAFVATEHLRNERSSIPGLTQAKLAELSGVKRATISRAEAADPTLPISPRTARKIYKGLQLAVKEASSDVGPFRLRPFQELFRPLDVAGNDLEPPATAEVRSNEVVSDQPAISHPPSSSVPPSVPCGDAASEANADTSSDANELTESLPWYSPLMTKPLGSAVGITVLVGVAVGAVFFASWTTRDDSAPPPTDLPGPLLVDETSELEANLAAELVSTQKTHTRGVYRRNSPQGIGHDLWCGGMVRVTEVDVTGGSVERLRHPARRSRTGVSEPYDEIRAKATVVIGFRSTSTGARRLYLSPGFLAALPFGRLIDPDGNGSKARVGYDWKDAPATGSLTVDLEYHQVAGKVQAARLHVREHLEGLDMPHKFTRDVLIPLRLVPLVRQAFEDSGINVPVEGVTGTATDDSRARAADSRQ